MRGQLKINDDPIAMRGQLKITPPPPPPLPTPPPRRCMGLNLKDEERAVAAWNQRLAASALRPLSSL